MNALGKAIVAVALVMALACIGGGVYMIVQRETGTRATATVTDCVRSGRGYDCTGNWVVCGDLGSGGDVVLGTIVGADQSDLGKTIDVTVSGDTAYSRSLGLPIALMSLGLVLAAISSVSAAPRFLWTPSCGHDARARRCPCPAHVLPRHP